MSSPVKKTLPWEMAPAIFALAWPTMLEQLMQTAVQYIDTAMVGSLGTHATAAVGATTTIGWLLGSSITALGVGFLSFIAQAYGAGDNHTTTLMLARSVMVALVVGLLMLILQRPIGEAAIKIMNGGEQVAEYFYARIWAVPAGVLLFALNGWLTGMQNAIIPMIVAIVVNVIHIACSLWFAFPLGMGIVGIAYASVVAQWTGVVITAAITWWHYGKRLVRISWREVMDMQAMRAFFVINRDIIIRTLCLVATYTFFTAASARMDDPTILAVNTILMELFTLFSYMTDGFAYATEALTGRFIGAKDLPSLKKCLRYCVVWTFATAIIAITAYLAGWEWLFSFFLGNSSEQELATVLTTLTLKTPIRYQVRH